MVTLLGYILLSLLSTNKKNRELNIAVKKIQKHNKTEYIITLSDQNAHVVFQDDQWRKIYSVSESPPADTQQLHHCTGLLF